MPFVIAGVFYFVFNFIVSWGMGRLEKRLSYYR
jgi:ABC-type amino acid transport system permease subunit